MQNDRRKDNGIREKGKMQRGEKHTKNGGVGKRGGNQPYWSTRRRNAFKEGKKNRSSVAYVL